MSDGPDVKSRSRGGKVRVKTARGRTVSSTRWLERQLNDPYVAEAKRLGYRSRAAFKLAELDDRFGFLKKARGLVDLGAAPGGWTQIAVARMGKDARIIGIDLQEMEPIPGAILVTMDFMAGDAPEQLARLIEGRPIDVVLSDMANAATGHKQTDHLRTMALCEAAAIFAFEVLEPGGTFIAKVLQGGTDRALLDQLKRRFSTVKHIKPPSSRKDSTEWYAVAQGFRG